MSTRCLGPMVKSCLMQIIYGMVILVGGFTDGKASAVATNTVDIFQDIERGLFYPSYPTKSKAAYREDVDIRHEGRNRKNKKAVEITVEKAGNNFQERQDYVKMEQMAYLAASNGYHETALELYKRLVKVQPDNYYLKFGLASAYQNLNQTQQAKPLYLEILRQFPNDTKVINNLLNILIDESPVEAAYFLADLATKNPKSPYINAQAGLAYQGIGNYSLAYHYLMRATELEPDNLQYRFNLAVVLDKNQEYNAAVNNYRQVLTNSNSRTMMDEQTLEAIKNRVAYLQQR